MADKQFDVSPAEQRLFLEKQKQRAALRAQYLKSIYDPHRHASGEGGHVFDEAMFRQMAARAKQYDHFRPNPKTAFIGFSVVALPCILYGWAIMSHRNSKEASFRNGEVSYRDRQFKFV